jgi:hypothetical protein
MLEDDPEVCHGKARGFREERSLATLRLDSGSSSCLIMNLDVSVSEESGSSSGAMSIDMPMPVATSESHCLSNRTS